MEWLIGAAACLVAGGAFAAFAVPRHVSYTETRVIGAPLRMVYDNIRSQRHLMRWSAWPSETNSTCECAGEDGQVGARTVFYVRGKRFGHQEVTALVEPALVQLRLHGAGPPQTPVLTFELQPLTPDRTEVTLRFANEIGRPFNVLLRLFGVVRWTREMHRKDLDGLRRYCEPPFLTYTGEPACPSPESMPAGGAVDGGHLRDGLASSRT